MSGSDTAKHVVDAVLEVPVVTSFTRLGYDVRSRLENWRPLDGYDLRGRVVLVTGAQVSLLAHAKSRVMLLGGAKLEGERHLFWNFVSSDPDRIERAKADWKARRFPLVPGDEQEFIPLPE